MAYFTQTPQYKCLQTTLDLVVIVTSIWGGAICIIRFIFLLWSATPLPASGLCFCLLCWCLISQILALKTMRSNLGIHRSRDIPCHSNSTDPLRNIWVCDDNQRKLTHSDHRSYCSQPMSFRGHDPFFRKQDNLQGSPIHFHAKANTLPCFMHEIGNGIELRCHHTWSQRNIAKRVIFTIYWAYQF